MTNKEAIEKLKEISFMTGYKEAIDLALKALRRADCIYIKDECLFACGAFGTCDAEEEGGTDG